MPRNNPNIPKSNIICLGITPTFPKSFFMPKNNPNIRREGIQNTCCLQITPTFGGEGIQNTCLLQDQGNKPMTLTSTRNTCLLQDSGVYSQDSY